jgi:hypothetical protein
VLKGAGVQASSVRRIIKSKNRLGKNCCIAQYKITESIEYSPQRLNLKVIRALRDLRIQLSIHQKTILLQNEKRLR